MTGKRLVVRGRVQGVGFRDWAVAMGERLGVVGWVRNGGDGSVEVVVDGESDAVEEMVRACRRGPVHARVEEVAEEMVDGVDGVDADGGFVRR